MGGGEVVGGREDSGTGVFGFGCVLYESLSGRRAFPANDPFVAMAQVLSETPDMSALPERTPPAVRELLEACLIKDAEARPRDMRPRRFTLEDALGFRRAAALREGESVPTPHNLPAHST